MPSPIARWIFLEDEEATPLTGFPVLVSSRLMALEKALEDYLLLEERAQLAISNREAFDSKPHNEAWQKYSRLLASATEYTVLSSYGRAYPNVFWLRHSAVLARCLSGTMRRLLRLDSSFAREHGAQTRYAVLFSYLDKALSLTYQQVRRLSKQVGEPENTLFPGLLNIMRDNVLIFTEPRISADLGELPGYLKGHLHIDDRSLREGLANLHDWHAAEFESHPALASTVHDLVGSAAVEEPQRLLNRPGYVRYLSGLEGYDDGAFLSPPEVELWEELLPQLKEYELIRSYQRLVLPVGREGVRLSASDPRRRGSGLPSKRIYLSRTTRPLDFMTPWVLDPKVGRFGLIYDIREFSQSLSDMNRTSLTEQERSFQMIFRFQRRVGQIASERRLRLEKYLGDGALYSGINQPHKLLVVAILIQEMYRRAVEDGLPFDRGLRMALNFGQYRMLPVQTTWPGQAERYEFFGHGIVELTRLITGKAAHDMEEMKKLLTNLGYPEGYVEDFFAPLERRNLDVVDRGEEARRFRAYLNPNKTLMNEGIVATRAFIEELDLEGSILSLHLASDGTRRYVVVSVPDGVETVAAGFRKLGSADFKGIGSLTVYEVVDGNRWQPDDLETAAHDNLVRATDEVYDATMAAAERL